MPITEAPTKTCSKCQAEGISSPHCPKCGAPTYAERSLARGRSGGSAGREPGGVLRAACRQWDADRRAVEEDAYLGEGPGDRRGLFPDHDRGLRCARRGTAANEVDKELKEESGGDVSDASEIKAKAGLNQPLSLKGTTYRVLSAETAQSVGDEYTDAEANGTFVIVQVALTNQKKEPATISSDALRWWVATGRVHDVR